MLFENPHRSQLLNRDIAPHLSTTWEAIQESEFSGYDPGSYRGRRGQRFFTSSSSRLGKLWNRIVIALQIAGGYPGVKLQGLPEITSTKAVALSASALIALTRAGEAQARSEGEALIERLLRARDPRTSLWTADFEYTIRGSTVTPDQICTINSVFCAEAIWEWYRLTGDSESAAAIVSAAEGMVEHVPKLRDESGIAFTYSPGTEYYVHNSNALIAVLLTRAAELGGGRDDLREIAAGCIRRVLEDMDQVGVLRYAGEPTPHDRADNYHTGYVLRSLEALRDTPVEELVGKERVRRAVTDLYQFYMEAFHGPRGVTKIPGGRLVHAHSLAEALLVYATFRGRSGFEVPESFAPAVERTFQDLWDQRRGYFINSIWKLPLGLRRRDVTPMVRWSWSWMMLGLARLVEAERTQSVDTPG